METIAEFKRAMVKGSRWVFESHWHPTPVVRTCTNSRSKDFSLTHPTKDGSSWCDFPKKNEVTFLSDGIRIEWENGFLVYRRAN